MLSTQWARLTQFLAVALLRFILLSLKSAVVLPSQWKRLTQILAVVLLRFVLLSLKSAVVLPIQWARLTQFLAVVLSRFILLSLQSAVLLLLLQVSQARTLPRLMTPLWANTKYLQSGQGWDAAQLVRASDQHAIDAGSVPSCGKGFFSQSQLSVQALLRYPYSHLPPMRNCMHLHLCTH